ncbi:hypothetical protein L596_006207 [Steinernema carpocapsae]|uniref:Uncharacterized protein n=1 Tax=Steinernema carpocapsae TaxID=34508 RepID=A0A4U8V2T3_STECR|nr:hypothetical protein L596_006207 [Steinernema carpocapsae]
MSLAPAAPPRLRQFQRGLISTSKGQCCAHACLVAGARSLEGDRSGARLIDPPKGGQSPHSAVGWHVL